jgi:hypothetical protein
MSYTVHITIVDEEAGQAVHATAIETDKLPTITVDGTKIDARKPGNARVS